jgi:tRNA(Leu) C34 or U34 (ribose-2'-O)-methylase TrmL
MPGTMEAIIEGKLEVFQSGKNMPPQGEIPAIILDNPKYARNISMVIRAASCYGWNQVWFTGQRVSLSDPSKNMDDGHGKRQVRKKGGKTPRLPREERMKLYNHVQVRNYEKPFDHFSGATPIAVELAEGAEMLHHFEWPENPVLVFGPEDGSISKVAMRHCHRRVILPTRACLNLATAVTTCLYDWYAKGVANGVIKDLRPEELLADDRCFLKGESDEDIGFFE